ncbi:hypothetical protein [Nocardia miyunensis]|uniref:hypothetical protein n=1 Tax=Nocardia miyunensis TaxID=282684 RepID=UPI0008327A09|nr:hypothetical protein [Nocardia miyunensis]
MNKKAQMICVWCGPLCGLLFAIGAVFLGRFIPPLVAPSDGALVVARKWAEHTGEIRVGAMICVISMSLITPWGAVIAAQFRRLEGRFPVLSYVQVICVAVGTTVVVLMSMFWAVAAFRPTSYSPETVMMLNDIAYYLFLFTWTPFVIWALAVALAVFTDTGEGPVYPRYVGYISLWTGLLFCGAAGMEYFKTGPFAWNGVMALYVPVVVFFIWLAVLTVETIKNLNRGNFHDPAEMDGTPTFAHLQEA